MATLRRLSRELLRHHEQLTKAARDQEWFLEFSGQIRPLWKDALRISQSLEEIGRSRADDATIRREVRARLQLRLFRLLGYRKPGPQGVETAEERTWRLISEEGLTVEQVAERDGVKPESVMKRFSPARTRRVSKG